MEIIKDASANGRILITGGCGFIGTNLLDFMVRKGFVDFRVMDNLSVGQIDDLERVLQEHGSFRKNVRNNGIHYSYKFDGASTDEKFIELQVGDIRNRDACNHAVMDVSAVIHLAAQCGVPSSIEDPLCDCETNVMGTLNLLEACRQYHVDTFVFASSGASLGEIEPPVHEEKVPHPVSPYGASKLAGEAYCSTYHKTYGIKTVVLRFGNVYGPRSWSKTSVVAKFMKCALQGFPIEIYGDGMQSRDFIYVEDLCNAIVLSLKSLDFIHKKGEQPSSQNSNLAAGEIFQIATFKETTVNEIVGKIRMIAEMATGKKPKILHSGERTGEIRRNYSDISKAVHSIGFHPQVDLDTGLYRTWMDLNKYNRSGV